MKHFIFYIFLCFHLFSCGSKCYDGNQTLYRSIQYSPNGKVKYGFSDVFDNTVIPYKYNDAKQFNEGLAAVANNENKYGFIDNKDSIIIPFKYDYASSFGEYGFEGLAIVKMMKEWYLNPHMTDGMMGFINRQGELVVPMMYNTFGYNREFGLFRVTDKNGNFGWLDKKANEIIPCEHDSIIDVSDNIFTLRKCGEIVRYDNKGNILK